jgi:FkbM family methyltransferase
MITKNGNWWAPKDTVGRAADYMRDENFSCIHPINVAVEHCTKFTNAIDVGTWIGDSTIHMAGLFENVIGFEPHPMVYICCEKNLKQRDITNAEVYNYALSNENKLMTLYNGKSTFSGWVSDKEDLPTQIRVHDQQQVQTIVLDSYHFTDIDFIKIDCDSHEGFVVAGAEEFFKTNMPVVLIENKRKIHKDRQPDSMPDAIELLKSWGYYIKARPAKADYLLLPEEHRNDDRRL